MGLVVTNRANESRAKLAWAMPSAADFGPWSARLPLTLHWKKLYISGRSNDNDNLLGKRVQGESRPKLVWGLPNRSRVYEIDYGGSHIVALQRSSERRPLAQVESRSKLAWFLRSPMTGAAKNKARRDRRQPFPLLTLKKEPPHGGFYSCSDIDHIGHFRYAKRNTIKWIVIKTKPFIVLDFFRRKTVNTFVAIEAINAIT